MSAPFDLNTYRCTITSHVDGDTSHIVVDPGFDLSIAMTVRWTGIDAPEIGTPEGKAALAFVRAALPEGSAATLQTVRDSKEKYGRYLGTFIRADGVNVNDLMVSSGHAKPYDGGKR